MGYDVFISFSSADIDVAKKVCTYLEKSGTVKCWIAYRDIVPSSNYAEQLVEAIESCKLVLLILSGDSNRSSQVAREIERAGSKGIPILPLRIENVVLSKSLEYFISSHHWLNAYESDIEGYFPALKSAVESSLLGKEGHQPGVDVGTRQASTRPSSGIQFLQVASAGLFLAFLAGVIFLFRPQHQTSPGPKDLATSQGEPGQTGKAASPATAQDELIRELARRYRENKGLDKANSDDWTSVHPISIAFIDITESGVNNAQRDYVLNRLSEHLRQTGRYSIVERETIDRLLQELNLSSSSLADPATALKLGRVLAADLIVTGSLSQNEGQWLANMRFIETETTAVKCSVSALVETGGQEKLIPEMGLEIINKLQSSYPLQAKVSSASGGEIAINIGRSSGVAKGMVFNLLQKDKLPIGTATVTAVTPQQSYITPADNTVPVAEGMLLREQVRE